MKALRGRARIGFERFAGKLHHKFAVIDVFGDDPVVILGSQLDGCRGLR